MKVASDLRLFLFFFCSSRLGFMITYIIAISHKRISLMQAARSLLHMSLFVSQVVLDQLHIHQALVDAQVYNFTVYDFIVILLMQIEIVYDYGREDND